jgi:hypothetical protein
MDAAQVDIDDLGGGLLVHRGRKVLAFVFCYLPKESIEVVISGLLEDFGIHDQGGHTWLQRALSFPDGVHDRVKDVLKFFKRIIRANLHSQ